MLPKLLRAILVMAAIAALVSFAAVLTGATDSFWPVSIGLALGLAYAFTWVVPFSEPAASSWLPAVCVALAVVGTRYATHYGVKTGTDVVVLGGCFLPFAVMAVVRMRHRQHGG